MLADYDYHNLVHYMNAIHILKPFPTVLFSRYTSICYLLLKMCFSKLTVPFSSYLHFCIEMLLVSRFLTIPGLLLWGLLEVYTCLDHHAGSIN